MWKVRLAGCRCVNSFDGPNSISRSPQKRSALSDSAAEVSQAVFNVELLSHRNGFEQKIPSCRTISLSI